MKTKLPIIFSSLVLILAISIKIMDFSLIRNLQQKVFDSFQISNPRQYIQQPVKIIDIDEESLKRIGQWPWPRNTLAQMVKKLNEGGPNSIGFDIVFAEEDRTSPKNILPLWGKQEKFSSLINDLPDHDILFSQSLGETPTITGFVLTQEKTINIPQQKAGFSYTGSDPSPYLQNFLGAVTSLPIFEKAAIGNGSLNSTPDSDGILRRSPLVLVSGDKFYPSLVAESLRVAQRAGGYIIKATGASDEQDSGIHAVTDIKIGQFTIPTDPFGKLILYYTGHKSERFFPAWKILAEDFDAKQFEGYILLFGTSAAGLKDIRATPFSPTTSGIEVHVEAIEQVLSGEYLYRPDWIHGAEILLMFIIGVILIAMMAVTTVIWGGFFTLCILVASYWLSWQLFLREHLLVDPVTPGIAILLVFISESLIQYIISEKEKKQVKNAFSHYMSPDLVAQLANDPSSLKLGGETKNLTLLFSDIRGFTTISEGMQAEELTGFINRFLTPMTNIILQNKGTIDKYMGDAIMAFWNAPLNDPNHASNAANAALEMIKGVKAFNNKQELMAKESNKEFIPINIGIGLNTGDCCVGNMGSEQRFDYSVLGDDVNLASRLEGQSKYYSVDIIIGENTYKKLNNPAAIELDLIKVKGKNKPVLIYALLGGKDLSEKQDFIQLRSNFNEMLQYYRQQDWKKAKICIEKCSDIATEMNLNLQGLLDLYSNRVKAFLKTPPPKNWDGVYTSSEK